MAVTFEWYHESGYLTYKGKKVITFYGGGNCDAVGIANNQLSWFFSDLKHMYNCADLAEENWFRMNNMTLHLNTFDKTSTKHLLMMLSKMKKGKVSLYCKDWTKTRRYKRRMKAIKEERKKWRSE